MQSEFIVALWLGRLGNLFYKYHWMLAEHDTSSFFFSKNFSVSRVFKQTTTQHPFLTPSLGLLQAHGVLGRGSVALASVIWSTTSIKLISPPVFPDDWQHPPPDLMAFGIWSPLSTAPEQGLFGPQPPTHPPGWVLHLQSIQRQMSASAVISLK